MKTYFFVITAIIITFIVCPSFLQAQSSELKGKWITDSILIIKTANNTDVTENTYLPGQDFDLSIEVPISITIKENGKTEFAYKNRVDDYSYFLKEGSFNVVGIGTVFSYQYEIIDNFIRFKYLRSYVVDIQDSIIEEYYYYMHK
ncbi:MAG: hypothetical protein LBL90_02455 [Prevotellaceae bacterium]|jgi:hypothetical protein|nr:hypothetical protein [Prevotellaceae bacterium]